MLLRTRTNLGIRNLITRVYRLRGGLYIPEFSVFVPRHDNVLAILRSIAGEAQLIPAGNIVTDAGDIHYAQRGCVETPTNAFGIQEMCTAGTPGKAATRATFTPVAASQKAHAATYPKTNDGDSDNTGAGVDVATWTVSYSAADFSQTGISHGIITNTSPGASEPILTGYAFAASFDKTSSDTLKVIVNHTLNGV
jgi:hypothetical protein